MSSSTFAILAAFVIYLGGMIIIGLRSSRKTESAADFFLGSRRMGPWISALSAEASDMSGWLLMGLPGVAYLTGMKEAFWTALGLTVGTWLNWLFVAKRLRKYSIHSKDSITIPEFFTNRFRDRSRLISFVSVIFILIFFTIYTASGFVACAKLFNSVFGFPYLAGLLLGIAVILAYTLAGGYLAVCSTDFVQGTLMFAALLITTVVGTVSLGGPAEAIAKVSAFGEEFLNPFVAAPGVKFGAIDIISALAWGLGYFGMPHILVRFMAVRSASDIGRSRIIAMLWVSISLTAAVAIGLLGHVWLDRAGVEYHNQAEAERIYIRFASELFFPLLSGVMLSGILAAIMSTVSSQLLVVGSALVNDIFLSVFKKTPERNLVMISRISILAVATAGIALAWYPESSVMGFVSYAWAGFGATFSPVILLSLIWKRLTLRGSLAGIVFGGIAVIFWESTDMHALTGYTSIVPCFIFATAIIVLTSLLDHKPNSEITDCYKKAASL